MEEYISLFNTTAEFENAESGLSRPHVSVTKDDMSVHYLKETRVVAKFNVTNTASPTKIFEDHDDDSFSAIEIDGVAQQSVITGYTFNTRGEHTVKYTLADPTSIGDSTFSGCINLISVFIPNSVTSIGYYAFNDCSDLTSISIPNSVTNIGGYAFVGCSSLTSITVDSSNLTYDSRNNCNAIIKTSTNKLIQGCKNTVIPNSVTSIGSGAFQGCSGLTSIEIPSGVTNIGDYAFQSCNNLTKLNSNIDGVFNIPSGVTSIGSGAFRNCSGFTSIIIPNTVTKIYSYFLQQCTSLTSITCNATTAPRIYNNTFQNIVSNGTLYVPIGSSGYDTWMQNANYYLGLYNWTKVEQ